MSTKELIDRLTQTEARPARRAPPGATPEAKAPDQGGVETRIGAGVIRRRRVGGRDEEVRIETKPPVLERARAPIEPPTPAPEAEAPKAKPKRAKKAAAETEGAEAPPELAPESEEKKRDTAKDAKGKGANKGPVVRIDAVGIEDRIVALPVGVGARQHLRVGASGEIYFIEGSGATAQEALRSILWTRVVVRYPRWLTHQRARLTGASAICAIWRIRARSSTPSTSSPSPAMTKFKNHAPRHPRDPVARGARLPTTPRPPAPKSLVRRRRGRTP